MTIINKEGRVVFLLPFKLPIWSIIVVGLAALIIYSFNNFQKSGSFLPLKTYKTVNLIELLSFGNFYNQKKICTRGYYVLGEGLEILKIKLDDDNFERSTWISNLTQKDIILTSVVTPSKYVDAKLCGLYHFKRLGGWGSPPVWNHLLEVEKFETFGEYQPL